MKIKSFEAIALRVPEDDPLANMPEEAGRKRARPGGTALAHRRPASKGWASRSTAR